MANETDSLPIWWLDRYKSMICVALGVFQVVCGLVTAISISGSCIGAGILQMLGGVSVVIIEAPNFLSFAAGLRVFFNKAPNLAKVIGYTCLVILTMLPGCWGVFCIFGMLAGFGIAIVYFAIIIFVRRVDSSEIVDEQSQGPAPWP